MSQAAASVPVIALAADERSASNGVLVLAAVVSILAIVALITVLKLHRFSP